jgi:hypothetical protein
MIFISAVTSIQQENFEPKRAFKSNDLKALENFSRVDWIRTSDPLHPIQVRYRAAPPPELEIAGIAAKPLLFWAANVT